MKKTIAVFAVLLLLLLAACSSAKKAAPEGDSPSGLIPLDAGVWPENEYTQGLPVPPGMVVWAMLDTEHQNCSALLTGVSEEDFDQYMQALEQAGFSEIENVSEKLRGEDSVSIGTLLTNGEKGLSISYMPDGFTIYISFETD